GLVDISEPFTMLRNQGIILGADGEKMSKSRGNVVNPDDLVAQYGADTVRAFLMFIGPWDQGGPWNYQGIEGVYRFLHRVWALVVDQEAPAEPGPDADPSAAATELRRAVHKAIKEVTEDLEAFRFNTAVSELMTLANAMGKAKPHREALGDAWTEAVRSLLLLMAPFTPHVAEELWERSGFEGSVHLQTWPAHDEAALMAETVRMAVQVNGKVRGQVEVPVDADDAAVLAAARSEPNVARYLAAGEVVREIVVKGRMVSFVVKG